MKNLLKPADRVEVTVLVDNYIDIFVPPSTPVDHRQPFDPCSRLLAEHGFSCLVRVFSGSKEYAILLDAGLSRESLYKALSGERNPEFDTILRVIEALGLELHAEAART